jgi:hypothetical protein
VVAQNAKADSVTTYRTVPVRRLVLVLLAPLLIVGDALFVSLADVGSPGWRMVARGAVVIGTALGYVLYRMTHTIVLRDAEASVEFRSILRRRVVLVAEIRAIVPGRFQSDLVVSHARGSERMFGPFPELDEVLAWIRLHNPQVSFGGILDR